MEKKVIFNREDLYTFSHRNVNTAYDNKRKINNAAHSFVVGENEELEVSVRPEINEGQEEWNLYISIK